MKYIKMFEEFNENLYSQFKNWLSDKDVDLYDGEESLKNKFEEILDTNDLPETKASKIADYMEEHWGLYDGYEEVLTHLINLFKTNKS